MKMIIAVHVFVAILILSCGPINTQKDISQLNTYTKDGEENQQGKEYKAYIPEIKDCMFIDAMRTGMGCFGRNEINLELVMNSVNMGDRLITGIPANNYTLRGFTELPMIREQCKKISCINTRTAFNVIGILDDTIPNPLDNKIDKSINVTIRRDHAIASISELIHGILNENIVIVTPMFDGKIANGDEIITISVNPGDTIRDILNITGKELPGRWIAIVCEPNRKIKGASIGADGQESSIILDAARLECIFYPYDIVPLKPGETRSIPGTNNEPDGDDSHIPPPELPTP
jgi:hypothetical protein